MKKQLLALIVLSLLATGCQEKESTNNVENSNRPAINETKTDDKETNNATDTEETEEDVVQTDISYYAYVTDKNGVVVLVKNNGETNLDVDLTVQFNDSHMNSVNTVLDSVKCLEPEHEAAILLEDVEDWSTYDIKVNTAESKKKSHNEQIKLTHKDTGKNIEVRVTNTLDETIDEINIGVAYYNQAGSLIDFVNYDTVSLDGKLTGTINIDYPKDNKNRQMVFANYVVFVNEMYSEK